MIGYKSLALLSLVNEKVQNVAFWQGHLGTWSDIKEFEINLWSIDKSDFNCKIYQADFSRSLLLKLQNYRIHFAIS